MLAHGDIVDDTIDAFHMDAVHMDTIILCSHKYTRIKQHRYLCRSNERSVCDSHAVVHLVLFFKASQNGDGVLHSGLFDLS